MKSSIRVSFSGRSTVVQGYSPLVRRKICHLPTARIAASGVDRAGRVKDFRDLLIGPRGERVACPGGGDRAAKIISTREGRGATDRGEYRQAA